MKYRFAPRQDYSDFASGKVFLSWPGRPAFPVRLGSEIFQRCLALRRGQGLAPPVALYDPCCGGGYLLSLLAYLHGPAIGRLIGSDIDPAAIQLARRNLSLLTLAGLDRRSAEIEAMLARYGKASHAEALASAKRLRGRLLDLADRHRLAPHLFQADAADKADISAKLSGLPVDVVIADVPYGQSSSWQTSPSLRSEVVDPLWQMLEALSGVLSAQTIVAIAADKAQKINHAGYRRLEQLKIGKRQIVFLRPLPLAKD